MTVAEQWCFNHCELILVSSKRETLWPLLKNPRSPGKRSFGDSRLGCGPGGLNPVGWEYYRDVARKPVMTSVLVIDATQPAPPHRYPPRVKVPEKMMDHVRLEGLLHPFDPKIAKP